MDFSNFQWFPRKQKPPFDVVNRQFFLILFHHVRPFSSQSFVCIEFNSSFHFRFDMFWFIYRLFVVALAYFGILWVGVEGADFPVFVATHRAATAAGKKRAPWFPRRPWLITFWPHKARLAWEKELCKLFKSFDRFCPDISCKVSCRMYRLIPFLTGL